jgi:hypothetical protein
MSQRDGDLEWIFERLGKVASDDTSFEILVFNLERLELHVFSKRDASVTAV